MMDPSNNVDVSQGMVENFDGITGIEAQNSTSKRQAQVPS